MRLIALIITIIAFLSLPARAQDFQISLPIAHERAIYLLGPIDDGVALGIINDLKKLNIESADDIILYITSPGGSVYSGLAIYDAMQASEAKINTVCIAYCMSMGALILAAGDTREATERTTIMVHQLSGGAQGRLAEMVNEIAEAKRLQDIMNKILSEKTGLSIKQVIDMSSFDHYMTAEQAKEYGLIDIVRKSRKRWALHNRELNE